MISFKQAETACLWTLLSFLSSLLLSAQQILPFGSLSNLAFQQSPACAVKPSTMLQDGLAAVKRLEAEV